MNECERGIRTLENERNKTHSQCRGIKTKFFDDAVRNLPQIPSAPILLPRAERGNGGEHGSEAGIKSSARLDEVGELVENLGEASKSTK